MRDSYGNDYLTSSLFEIPNTAHGRWRRRQLYREMLRAMLYTGDSLLDATWAYTRPMTRDIGGKPDPESVRNLARYWGLTL